MSVAFEELQGMSASEDQVNNNNSLSPGEHENEKRFAVTDIEFPSLSDSQAEEVRSFLIEYSVMWNGELDTVTQTVHPIETKEVT